MKGSNRRQQLNSQQRRQWQSIKPKNTELYNENTLTQLRKQSRSSLILPFLLQISPTSCLGFSALQSEQSQSTQRGDVCQAPQLAPASCRELKGCPATPGGDGTAKTTAGACMDSARSAASLPARENSFGKTRVTSNHQAGHPHGKKPSFRFFSITVLSFIFFLWLGLDEHPFSFPHCQCLVLSHPVPLHPHPLILQSPLLPKSGFISSSTSPTTRSPLSSYSQQRVLCFPADLNSSLLPWAKNHSEQWHFKLCREGR